MSSSASRSAACSLKRVVSRLSRATRARPAALVFSSSTIWWSRFERVAGSADLGEHAAGHLVHFGERLVHLHAVEVLAQCLDFVARGFDGGVAGHDQFLVGFFGVRELGTVIGQFFADALEFEGDLAGEPLVSGAEVGGGLRLEFLLLALLALHLGDEFLAQPGVRREPLVELSDLSAEVFLFHFEQRFRDCVFPCRR